MFLSFSPGQALVDDSLAAALMAVNVSQTYSDVAKIVSGEATALAVGTGAQTLFGKAALSLNRLLLGILDKATLRLGDNSVVNFERSIIFMTACDDYYISIVVFLQFSYCFTYIFNYDMTGFRNIRGICILGTVINYCDLKIKQISEVCQ